MWSQHWSAVNLHSFSWPAGGGENHLLLTWFTPPVNSFLMSLHSQSFVSGLSIHSINYGPITSKIYAKSGFTVRRGYPVIDTHNNHQSAPPSPNMVSRNKEIVTDIKPKSSSFKNGSLQKVWRGLDCSRLLFQISKFSENFLLVSFFYAQLILIGVTRLKPPRASFFPPKLKTFSYLRKELLNRLITPTKHISGVSLLFFFFFLQCFFRHTSKLCHHGAKHGCLEICDTTENPAGFLSKWANTQKKT